jgi:hypothetical protein
MWSKLKILSNVPYHLSWPITVAVWSKAICHEQICYSLILGSHSSDYKITLFWDVTPCSLIDIYRGLGGTWQVTTIPDYGWKMKYGVPLSEMSVKVYRRCVVW